MTTPVSKVVNVRIITSPTFPQRAGFGLLNIIGTSARLPLGERIRFYADIDGVSDDFQTTDEEYKAALVYFSQMPRPVQLAISRRFPNGAAGELLGSGDFEQTLATWQAVTAGGFDITIDGVLEKVSALDFSAATTFNQIAAIMQAALAAESTGATVTYDGSRFVIRSGTTGLTSTVGYMVPATTAATTDISALTGLDAAAKGKISNGIAAEAVTDSLAAIHDINQSWYGFAFAPNASEQEVKDAAAWTEAQVKIFGYTTSSADVLQAGTTSDIASFLKSSMYSRTFGVWDDNDAYAAISAIARAFTVNFNEQNSTITLKFKVLPGITTVELTESQRLALVSKNMNYYTLFGDSAMLAEGVMASGQFFDERHGLDWLQNAIQTNVFGYLYTRTTKVPQTDKGVAGLVQMAERACAEGVNNGLLAPGQWNGMDLGEVKSGDYLARGFYVYAQPIAQQNQSDREARKSPPIQILCKGAGAIHFADITVTFER